MPPVSPQLPRAPAHAHFAVGVLIMPFILFSCYLYYKGKFFQVAGVGAMVYAVEIIALVCFMVAFMPR